MNSEDSGYTEKIIFENFTTENLTGKLENVELFGRHFPAWATIFYFTFISIGGLIDVCLIIGLMKCKRKGINLILLQLLLVDVLSVLLLIPEILLLRFGSWVFPQHFCSLFLGGEILINCLAIYLIICLNFHVISIWNLHLHEASQGKNPLTSCNGDDSNECLVKKNETPTTSRNLTIDYRRKKTDVSIILPSLLIWCACISLSVPQYTLATILKLKIDDSNTTLCTVISTRYDDTLQHFLILFKAVVPIILLVLSFILLLFKLFQSRVTTSVSNALSKNLITTRSLIVLCIMLSLTCFMTFLPRNVPYIMHTLANNKTFDDVESFKIPPLYNLYISEYHAIFLAMLHYSSIPIRTVVCMACLPTLKKFFQEKMCVSRKKEEDCSM